MKRQVKSLLPKSTVDREALTHSIFNIKPRFSLRAIEGLKRLKRTVLNYSLIAIIVFVTISPILANPVYAQSLDTQNASSGSFSEPASLPHGGYLSTKFSSYHQGIDIAVAYGTEIHPISGGVIELVGFETGGYGNYVVVNHGNGFTSLYAHMGKVSVKVGQQVSKADVLGTVGMTGRTTGPHTHLEIHSNGKAIDPITILPPVDPFPIAVTSIKIAYLKPVK